ncbi:MAG: DUF2796 domain-containing protein [Oligoflexia bacterium]|nr:DUF2796 domain-containing protein [Oligoflexia bacterium]
MRLLSLSIIACVLSLNTYGQKSLGKHVHGSIGLDIATDKKQILIMLKGPSDSFLGFEYKAKTKEEKEKLNKVKNLLTKKVTSLFGKEIESCKAKSPQFKQTFQGKGHSEVQLETYVECPDSVKGKTMEVQLISKFPRMETIHVQLLREDGSVVSKKFKKSKFELKL